jgi:hypothetical protein
MAELEAAFLAAVGAGQVADSGDFAAAQNVDHQVLVGLLKSLLASDMITTEVSWAGPNGRSWCSCTRTQRRRQSWRDA